MIVLISSMFASDNPKEDSKCHCDFIAVQYLSKKTEIENSEKLILTSLCMSMALPSLIVAMIIIL